MDIQSIRQQFPITANYNFLNHAAVAPISLPTAQAMRYYVDHLLGNSVIDSGFYEHCDKVRRDAATLINADAREVTFTKNTTEGLGWVAAGLDWKPGDNIISTDIEFPANIYPWMGLADRGVEFRKVSAMDNRFPVEHLASAIDERTRLVSISAVQFATGFRTDLAALGQICRERNIYFCVDAIQALGAFPVDVEAMNIDFLSADGHKWLCGPEGLGIFYCRGDKLDCLKPVYAGWTCMKNAQDYGNYQFEFLDSAQKFDSGSYNLAGIYGLGASIGLFLELGIDNAATRILELTDRLVTGLTDKGYDVISSRLPGEASGIVSFTSPIHNHQAIQRTLEKDHHVAIAFREGRLRASPHVYNTPEEIDQLLDLLPDH